MKATRLISIFAVTGAFMWSQLSAGSERQERTLSRYISQHCNEPDAFRTTGITGLFEAIIQNNSSHESSKCEQNTKARLALDEKYFQGEERDRSFRDHTKEITRTTWGPDIPGVLNNRAFTDPGDRSKRSINLRKLNGYSNLGQ